MPLDVIDVTAPPATKHHTNHAVSTITHGSSSSTLTLGTAEASAPADGDYIARASNWGYEIQGFFNAVRTGGTYMNIPHSGNEGWQGVIVDAAGGGGTAVALDPDHLRDSVDGIMEVSGHAPNYIVCNFKQRRSIYNLYAPQIRYAPMVLPGGLREGTLAFDDIPVLVERFFPPEHIGFLNTAFWYHAIDKNVEWIQGLNGTVLHFTLTADVFKAVMRTYRNMVCLYPATNGYLYGLAE